MKGRRARAVALLFALLTHVGARALVATVILVLFLVVGVAVVVIVVVGALGPVAAAPVLIITRDAARVLFVRRI